MEPSMLPCGTPAVTVHEGERHPSMTTYCLRSLRLLRRKSSSWPYIPETFSFVKRRSWSMESNAFLQSINTCSVALFLSKSRSSWSISRMWAGILERKVDHPSRRLIYYCPLDFVVGAFSIRHRWGFTLHETRYVRVVCSTLECHFCHCLVSTLIRTIFSGWRPQKIAY